MATKIAPEKKPDQLVEKRGITRREFVKDAGGLLIGFSMLDAAVLPRLLASPAEETVAKVMPGRLDAWMQVQPDGTIRVLTGKVEIGMGAETGLAQIVAEELDISPAKVAFVMGDTAMTADQGGVGGSTTISAGARPLRNVAASARSMLLQMASQKLGVPVDQLEVRDGVVHVKDNPSKSISYAALTGGTELNEALKVTGEGFALNVEGMGKPKDSASYTVVGQPVPRVDLRPKILGQWRYVTDVRVEGMLHGRVIRPAGVGAKLVRADEKSVEGIPGVVKVVVKGNFLGVVAESEWAAVRASQKLAVEWSDAQQAFPEQDKLYERMRTATPKASKDTLKKGDMDAGFASAAKKLEATYEFPFQSHATMGPGCAVADVRADGVSTVWSGGQKPHALQLGIAELLGVPAEKVRVVWMEDAGSYGRPGFEDTAADAAMLSQAVGKPVRVQWMRKDMTAWGTKGPAVACEMSCGLDAQGKVTAFRFTTRAYSGGDIMYRPDTAGNFVAAQLSGIGNTSGVDEFAQWGAETMAYSFANVHADAHVLPAFFDSASPLRTTHLRDPEGPATTFAGESFIDEMAAAGGVDPIAFRMQNLDDERIKAALKAVGEKYGWEARPSPKNSVTGDVVKGRGVAVGNRGGTRVATIAEVEVDRKTGAVRVSRLVCAHDCGLIINPSALRGTIQANLVQSMSRALFEEVMFDRSNVTSFDWRTYPVARAEDIPAQVDVVLINRPDQPSSGAGEPSSRPTGAAINNALFDATGVRLRRGPLTRARVKEDLAKV